MDKDYIRPFSLFIAIVFNNYIVFKFFLNQKIYQLYGHMGYIFIIILMIISFLLMLTFNDKRLNNVYSVVNNNKIVRLLLNIHFSISSIITLTLSARILVMNFFPSDNVIFFIVPLILVSIYMTKIKTVGVINIITIPALFYFIFFIVTNIVNITLKDYSLLLPFKMIEFPSFEIIIISLFTLFDNYLFYTCGNDLKKPFKRKYVFLANLLFLVFELVELINITALAGNNFLYDYEFIGFLSYSVMQTFKYIGDFQFIYIYLITLFTLFKINFNHSMIMHTTTKKKAYIEYFIILIAVFVMANNYTWFSNNLIGFVIVALVLMLPYIIYCYVGD